MQSSISLLQLSFGYHVFSWAFPLWFSPPSTTVPQHSRWGGGSRDQLISGNCCSHYQNFKLMTSKCLPIFSRISCYYLCFSGWMNQHNFIKLAVCYVSCTPWKAILETNDCKASHNSSVNSPCCSLAEDSLTSTGIKREEMTEQWWHTASAPLETTWTQVMHQQEDVPLCKISAWKESWCFSSISQPTLAGLVALWERCCGCFSKCLTPPACPNHIH